VDVPVMPRHRRVTLRIQRAIARIGALSLPVELMVFAGRGVRSPRRVTKYALIRNRCVKWPCGGASGM
jgi:hypothetical protein